MPREPDPATPSHPSTTLDVVLGLLTAGLAAALAITIFTVQESFGFRRPETRVKCAR